MSHTEDAYTNASHELLFLSEELPGLYHIAHRIYGFHFTNRIDRYALTDGNGGLLLIDVGHPKLTGTDALDTIVRLAGSDWSVTDAFITHFHGDHCGNLPYLAQKKARGFFHGSIASITDEVLASFAPFAGWYHEDPDQKEDFDDALALLDEVTLPEGLPATELDDGDRITMGDFNLEVLHTPGHTAEHLCLADHERKILFAGDHIVDGVPGIMQLNPEGHLLTRFMESFVRLKTMSFETAYLSHREPLKGSDEIAALCDHIVETYRGPLEKRLSLVKELGTATVAQVTLAAERSGHALKAEPRRLSRRMSNTLCYMEYLHDRGILRRRFRDDGAALYEVAQHGAEVLPSRV